jgi:lipid-A-disaccharide synthase
MHIFFSVGEPSGDLHAAKLVAELRGRVPGTECSGFGGPLMESAGCRLIYRLTDLAVMGILPVIPLLFRFVRLIWQARKSFEQRRPDAVVLVDFPGFNWWIARSAKKRGIPVFYYLPPQLWAWAPWRVGRMRKFVDLVLSVLPFEVEWYQRRQVAAEFVGHPFFDEVAQRKLDEAFLNEHASPVAAPPECRVGRAVRGLPDRSMVGLTSFDPPYMAGANAMHRDRCPVVAVLPGSRNHEVAHNFPIQIRVMRRLGRRLPGVRFLVAAYKEGQRETCARMLAQRAPELAVSLHVGKTSEIIELADAALMVSGSVSLELLARTTPAVVVYRVNRALNWFARFMLTCRYVSLPNLIADRPVMPEFVRIGDPRPAIAAMTDVLHHWLTDRDEYLRQKSELARLRALVGGAGATKNAAAAILNWLESHREPQRRAA